MLLSKLISSHTKSPESVLIAFKTTWYKVNTPLLFLSFINFFISIWLTLEQFLILGRHLHNLHFLSIFRKMAALYTAKSAKYTESQNKTEIKYKTISKITPKLLF